MLYSRHHLDTVLSKLNIIKDDMYYVRRVFVSKLQENEEMRDETLSLIRNYQEIQRLEQEMNEKRKHIQGNLQSCHFHNSHFFLQHKLNIE